MYIELIVNPFDFGFYDSAPEWKVVAHYNFESGLISDITINGLQGTFDLMDSPYKRLMVKLLTEEGQRVEVAVADDKYGPV